MPLRMVGRGVPPSRLGRGTRPACSPTHPPANYQLPINQLPTCLYVLQETTGTTCKNNIFFLAAQPRGDLEIGRGLVRHSLGEGGCARMARVVFISCHGCFLFNETYSHLHSVRNTHHPPTNQLPTHQLPTNHEPPPTNHHPRTTNHPPHKIFVRAFTLPADWIYLFPPC